MNIVLLHDRIAPDARADELDVLAQVEAVGGALRELGHAAQAMPFYLDLTRVNAALTAARPDCVFNLVESVEGQGRLIHLAPALLDTLKIPYTGAPCNALFLTSNKPLAKLWLVNSGLPTPEWTTLPADGSPDAGGGRQGGARNDSRNSDHTGGTPVTNRCHKRYIIKSVWEHASVGLDEGAVVDVLSAADLQRVIAERAPRLGGQAFAEAYIEGREFNISLLAGGARTDSRTSDSHSSGPTVLPHAEIVFEDFPPGQPRIVDYRAKWVEDSFEYHHTPRRFNFPASDAPLLAELTRLSIACWRAFGLRGYARVDFRVDRDGRPFILEINANPCLSPDAGYAAALVRAGIPFVEAVRRILADVE